VLLVNRELQALQAAQRCQGAPQVTRGQACILGWVQNVNAKLAQVGREVGDAADVVWCASGLQAGEQREHDGR
jgi:hypothetical protein